LKRFLESRDIIGLIAEKVQQELLRMTKANVYIKGKTVEVPLESLEDYFIENADKIEPRPHSVRRPRHLENPAPAQTNC
jgi:hypothetical protein